MIPDNVRQLNVDIQLPSAVVAVRDVLPTLGFTEKWGTFTDLEPAFAYRRGGIDIEANQNMNRYFRTEIFVGGIATNGRTLCEIDFSMPLRVESRDQVVAWLAFGIGTTFEPTELVPWFEEGKLLQHQIGRAHV